MTMIAAQVSLYPLGRDDLGPPIAAAIATFLAHDLRVHPGEMSSIVIGTDIAVFDALREAFKQAAAEGAAVMTFTVSNACPLPDAPESAKE